jgi:hypothetical protein
MRITRQNTTGLVVDIQERLFPVMWEKEKLIKNCRLLLQGLNVTWPACSCNSAIHKGDW